MLSLAVTPVLGIVISLHALAAVIWVGGLFFAYVALRPAAAGLAPSVRLGLWVAVFHRFFPWIWAAVVVLVVTGLLQIAATFGTFSYAPPYVLIMTVLGGLMVLLFAYVYFLPWRQLKQAVGEQRWDDGIASLGRIRRVVLINLLFGLATVVSATGGRYF